MEKLLIFDSAKEVRFGKLLKFIKIGRAHV